MLLTFLFLSTLLVGSVWAQNIIESYNSLCDETFADANHSGVFSFAPGFATSQTNPDFTVADVSWAWTVLQNDTSLQGALWYNTGGANYSDDFLIGYDVCGVQIDNVTALAMYNGQNDDGSCTATLDSDCITALTTLAERTARDLVGFNQQPRANLTDGALPGVCQSIGEAIQNNLPTECTKHFVDPVEALAFQMTDYNYTSSDVGCCSNIQYPSCPIYDNPGHAQSQVGLPDDTFSVPWSNDTGSAVYNESRWDAYWNIRIRYGPGGPGDQPAYDWHNYDYFTQAVFPMMTVFMPIANNLRTYDFEPKAHLTCVHANNANALSRIAPDLKRPAGADSGLSGGEIAGAVVGSVLGTILIVMIIMFFLWRRHKQSRSRHGCEKTTELHADSRKFSELSNSQEKLELHGKSSRVESPTGNEHERHEMKGHGAEHEMDGDAYVGELMGDLPRPYELGGGSYGADRKQ